MKNDELKGVIVPVVTPVDSEERVDETAFRKLLRRLIAAGVHGIFVGGSAGEGPLLVMREWERMVRIGFEEVNGKAALLGGVSDTSARRMSEKIKILQGIGYTRYVVTPTFYIGLKRPEEHLRLFGAAKEAGGSMEMIAYNIPQCVGSALAVETLVEITRRGWVRYCKESSGDWTYFNRVLTEAGAAGLKVLMGDELLIPEGLLAGAVGIVPVCANYDPKLFIRAYAAGAAGDEAELRNIHKTIVTKRAMLVAGGACWLSGIKLAVSLLGMGTGEPLSPLQPVEGKQKADIEQMVKADQGTL